MTMNRIYKQWRASDWRKIVGLAIAVTITLW
jgi:hypothetical protein